MSLEPVSDWRPGHCAPAVGRILQINTDWYNNRKDNPPKVQQPAAKKENKFYFLLRPKTTAAHPSPAMTPMTGAGEAPVCAACFVSTGFTCGISGVSVTVGVGVGVTVGVGVAVSQTEEPCGVLLLFFTGISYVSANGLNFVTSKPSS